MPIPEMGDADFGVLTTIEEAGGGVEWRLHNYSTDDIDTMITIAADSM